MEKDHKYKGIQASLVAEGKTFAFLVFHLRTTATYQTNGQFAYVVVD